MNWEKIKNNCPNSWSLFREQSYVSESLWRALSKTQEKLGKAVVMRMLYDFFDENRIFIFVTPEIQYTREIDEDGKNPHYVPEEWAYEIHDIAYHLDMDCPFRSRRKAEKAAFKKAFEIFEKRLK